MESKKSGAEYEAKRLVARLKHPRVKTKIKAFDLVGKKGTKRVWVVYGMRMWDEIEE